MGHRNPGGRALPHLGRVYRPARLTQLLPRPAWVTALGLSARAGGSEAPPRQARERRGPHGRPHHRRGAGGMSSTRLGTRSGPSASARERARSWRRRRPDRGEEAEMDD